MAQNLHVLEALDSALNNYKHILKNATQTVVDEGVSKYPIIVVHEYKVNMGLLLIDREKQNSPFSFSVSTLEEFVTKNLIEATKVDNFKQIYVKSEKSFCLFVIEGQNANFVFAPH